MASNPPKHYTANSSAFPLEGGCPCGQIRYRLEQAPLIVNCCHCTSCQRETGSAFAVNIIIDTASVTDLAPAAAATAPAHRGDPDNFPSTGPPLPPLPPASSVSTGKVPASDDDSSVAAVGLGAGVVNPTSVLVPSESQDGQTITHCPTCFTAVWSDYGSESLLRWVRGGTLDRPWLVAPDVHIFVRSKRGFVTIADGKPQFQESYKMSEVWRVESLERYRRVQGQRS